MSGKSSNIRDSVELTENFEPTRGNAGQCVSCSPLKQYRETDKKLLIIASVVCAVFMVAEIIGGILSHSLAIAADAAHLITDLAAFLINLLALYISGKSKTTSMNFGFYRAETLGALTTILILWVLVGVVFYLAIQRLVYPDYEIDGTVMVITASFGLLANIVLTLVLLSENILHKPHGEGIIPQRRIGLKSALIHVIGDLLYSIGLLFASLIILMKPEYRIVDPICSLIFSFLVITSTFHIMKDIIQVLMEGLPRHVQFQKIQETLLSCNHVIDVHHLRIWSLSMDKVALTGHLVIKKGENPIEVLKEASFKVSQASDIFESTLQVEEAGKPVTLCAICD